MPNLDAANISFNLLQDDRRRRHHGRRRSCSARRKPVHILTPTATVRRIVNMTALAVADAGAQRAKQLDRSIDATA